MDASFYSDLALAWKVLRTVLGIVVLMVGMPLNIWWGKKEKERGVPPGRRVVRALCRFYGIAFICFLLWSNGKVVGALCGAFLVVLFSWVPWMFLMDPAHVFWWFDKH